ncbi:trichohyalin-like [Zerene cesonia]|uniref:trichohyalin-like n=1 Tax=Zerene cesonia TaxID=33412 RepID=UPI0018E5660D|nr:trichohyalin-like [Zerene cesonia]
MGRLNKSKDNHVYFGHPFSFWRLRQRNDMESLINVDELKKAMDVAELDHIHIQKKQRLRVLLEREESELSNELTRKRQAEGCKYCSERKNKEEKYIEDLEHEKLVKCQMALEREKIANGIQSTKLDEHQLKAMQVMQMKEKKYIEDQQAEIDKMWHQVLLEDVRMKEEKDRRNAERLKREMKERRLAYDEQISSANRKRQEILQREREVENKRLENMKKRMEEDYFDAIKRKNEQQRNNRINYIKGHEMKMTKIRNEKTEEQSVDRKAIMVALEELQIERQRKIAEILSLQREKQIFLENVNRERKIAQNLDEETDRLVRSWKEEKEKESDSKMLELERERQLVKQKNASEYENYKDQKNREIENIKRERQELMRNVQNTAIIELQKKLYDANKELRKQMEYRNSLNHQMKQNQRIMEIDTQNIEIQQRPFTKKDIMFKDAMKDKMNSSRQSTNPVHPFRRLLQSSGKNKTIFLPVIE